MVNRTEIVSTFGWYQVDITHRGTTVRFHRAAPSVKPIEKKESVKKPSQTLYQQYLTTADKKPFTVAFLEESDISRIVSGQDSRRKSEILKDYINALKKGILPITKSILTDRKKEAALHSLNELLENSQITPLAFFDKNKTGILKQIYKAVKDLNNKVTLDALSNVISKNEELIINDIINNYSEYERLGAVDRSFAEMFSSLEKEANEYLNNQTITKALQEAKVWNPDFNEIYILLDKTFVLKSQDVKSYIEALKKEIGNEENPDISQIKFNRFLEKFNLSEKDLANVFCYWKVQKYSGHTVPVKASHINIHLKYEQFLNEDESSIKASFDKLEKLFTDIGLPSPFHLKNHENGNHINEKLTVSEANTGINIVRLECLFLKDLELDHKEAMPIKSAVQHAYLGQADSTKQILHDDFHKYNSDSKAHVTLVLSNGAKIKIDIEKAEGDIILADIKEKGHSDYIPAVLAKSPYFSKTK